MSTINKVILLGNVGNVEVKNFDGGKKIVQLSLATSESYKKGDDYVDKTEWHRCVFSIPALADRASTIQKGDKIYIEGSISTNSWVNKEGEKKEIKEISCVNLKVFSRSEKLKDTATTSNTPPPIQQGIDDDMPF